MTRSNEARPGATRLAWQPAQRVRVRSRSGGVLHAGRAVTPACRHVTVRAGERAHACYVADGAMAGRAAGASRLASAEKLRAASA